MTIQKIKASNFKSFDELEVELRPLNIVVGANAAGKSNFLEIFRFLRDCSELGFENAISLQGGMDYLANLKIGASRPVYLELTRTGSKWRVNLEKTAEAPGFTAWQVIPGPRFYKPKELTKPDFKAS